MWWRLTPPPLTPLPGAKPASLATLSHEHHMTDPFKDLEKDITHTLHTAPSPTHS